MKQDWVAFTNKMIEITQDGYFQGPDPLLDQYSGDGYFVWQKKSEGNTAK